MRTHTKKCLAQSVMAAVENIRDREDVIDTAKGITFRPISDAEFLACMRNGQAVRDAEAYLDDGTATCICPPVATQVI